MEPLRTITRTPIEHPHVLGAQNKHVLDKVSLAYKCALALADAGFTVLSIHIEHHRPVIWIQHAPNCDYLSGVWMVHSPTPIGFERVMVAVHEGCQVQWTVRGH